jgi:putative hydrolase of the HAD superfamily
MAISAVVFDWYATLAKPNPDDFWTRLADEIADAGGHPRPDVLAAWEVEHPVEHTHHSTDEATYRAWQRSRLDEVFAACGLDGPARAGLLDHIDGQRYTREYDVFPDVRPTLVELRRRGLATGLCSNWDWDLDRHLGRTEIADLFDVVVCSAQHGSRKPHASIFATVLDGVGAAPEDVLFVGDSWPDDVTGARAAGLRPVHVVRTGADGCAIGEHDGVPCVSTIADVLRLLD